MTVIGGGTGSIEVQLNWQSNTTVTFAGAANKTIVVDLLPGSNWITIFQTSGTPSVDAVVVGN